MRRLASVLVLATALLLAACGNKGDLVLPDKSPPADKAPAKTPADPKQASSKQAPPQS